MGCKF